MYMLGLFKLQCARPAFALEHRGGFGILQQWNLNWTQLGEPAASMSRRSRKNG